MKMTTQMLHITGGEVPRGEKMLDSGTDPESCITGYTLVYQDKFPDLTVFNLLVFCVGAAVSRRARI